MVKILWKIERIYYAEIKPTNLENRLSQYCAINLTRVYRKGFNKC